MTRFLAGGLAAALCAGVLLSIPEVAAQRPAPLPDTPRLLDESADVSVLMPDLARVRRRSGRLSPGFLDRVTGVSQPAAPRLTLNLFPNVVLTAAYQRSENAGTARSWIGTIQEASMGLVVLTVVQGVLTGSVAYEGGTYEITAAADGMAVVSEFDETRLAPLAEPLRPPSSRLAADADPVVDVAQATALKTITLAVFYTPLAQNQAGGASAMASRISNRIATANSVYRNSGINQKLSLVHSGQVAYNQSGRAVTDLNRLTGTRDGYMDGVHTTRTSKRADLVALIVGGSSWSQGACGIAWLFTPPLQASRMRAYAFSWTVLECMSGFTLEHELGHNMGAHHDSYVTGGAHGAYSYSHGYVDVSGRFVTVMAYTSQCAARRVNCSRIPYFSNPAKSYRGRVVGRSTADNRKTLNNTAALVAAFK